MRRLLRVLGMGGLLALVGWSQVNPLDNMVTEPKESLRGIFGVMVQTAQSRCEGVVDPSLAKQDMEVKLRVAGITVVTLPFASLNLDATCMPIIVAGRRSATVIHISLGFGQVVWLPPQPVRVMVATTWEAGTLLYCAAATKCDDFFRSQLRDYLDKFINDFLTVNPKR
jgi:hypothetical protein